MSDPLPVSALVIDRTGERLARVEMATTPVARRQGLLGRDGLAPGAGLLIRPCSSIHTWFMRFAIDVAFLDPTGAVVKIAHDVGPFRVVWGGWRAQDTLEVPSGTLAASGLRVGDRLRFTDA